MKKVAIQGIAGSYHHEAASRFFGTEPQLLECDSFRDLGWALKNGEVDVAVMAIENTIAGSILPNYALLSRLDLKIIGETYLRIHHHLLSLPEVEMTDVKEIHSHPMALLQCEKFFDSISQIKLVESIDTAFSAKEIAEKKWRQVASVAPKKSAEIYGLKILNDDIQTHPDNFTRFFIVAREEKNDVFFDKVSLRFSLKNYAGSLVSVLEEIARLGINMTKIQSMPLVNQPGEYSFYLDLLIDEVRQFDDLISFMKHRISDLEILGKYKNGKPQWQKQGV